jgi:hypothetical protein
MAFEFDITGIADPLLKAQQGMSGSLQNLGRGFGDRRRERAAKEEADTQRGFITSEREAGQDFSVSEREAIQAYQDAADMIYREFLTSERQAGEGFRTGEREAGQEYATGEREASETYSTGDREAAQRFMTSERLESEIYAAAQALLGRDFTTSEREAVETFKESMASKEMDFRTREREAGQEYGTSERVAGQEYRTDERGDTQTFAAKQADLARGFSTSEREAGQKYGTGERIAGEGFRTVERVAGQEFAAGENSLDRELERARIDLASLEAGNLNTYRNAMIAQQGGAADAAELVPVDKSTLAHEMFQYAKLQLMEMNSVIDEQTGQPTLNWSTDDPAAYVELKNKLFRIANDHAIERLVAAGETEEGIKEFLDRSALELLDQIPGPPGPPGIISPETSITSVAGKLIGGLAGVGGAVARGAEDYVKTLSGWLRGTVAPRTVKGDVDDATTEAFAWALVQKLQELDLTEEERKKLGNAGGITPSGYEWDLVKPLKGGITSRLPDILDYVVQLAQQYGLGAEAQ